MNLIIVESPTKAKTIQRFLDKNYEVLSSFGHIRDLPRKKLGIDIKNNFEPEYVVLSRAKKTILQLKKAAKEARSVILATDEDREGEAIAWHLVQALGLDAGSEFPIPSLQQKGKLIRKPKAESRTPKAAIERIAFHEITKKAIDQALKNPRKIDMNLVDSQQARRILDRLVGYKLSPFLWKKVLRGLSAGRVQSVAVRLIVEREREIEKFAPQEYWTLSALLENGLKQQFGAELSKIDNKKIDRLEIKTKDEADKILKELKGAAYQVKKIEKKENKRNPYPPFMTSTLCQEANKKLRFSTKQTMMFAQQLYEGAQIGGKGTTGLITYHRTDSLNLSKESLSQAETLIKGKFGPQYYFPRVFKTKSKSAQEAHEAIRPTDALNFSPETIKKYLNPNQYKLYFLIWSRFVASQMASAVFDQTIVEVKAGKFIFEARGQVIKFDGFLKVYQLKLEEIILPSLKLNEILDLIKLQSAQHFTQPPPRYNEASLIKTLEKEGIGRPSTYGPIISTIQERGYVKKENRVFYPAEIGVLVNDLLVAHFPDIVDLKFTSLMEEDLDKIAQGEIKWLPIVSNFYIPFKENLEKKEKEVVKQNTFETTEKKCPKCGKFLVVKLGRFGKFLSCSGFPECAYAEPIIISIGVKCPKCKDGEIIEKKTKKGKTFWACNKWPKCDYASWEKPKNPELTKSDIQPK